MLFSYPLEIVSTRMSSDMTRYGHKRIYSGTIETLMRIGYTDEANSSRVFPLTNYYKGFSVNILGSVLYYSTLLISLKLQKPPVTNENKGFLGNYSSYFRPSIISGILASFVSYPFDTVKRIMQVNGAFGYHKLYFSIPHVYKQIIKEGVKGFYRGFPIHAIKNIPYAFLLHLNYAMIESTHEIMTN